MKKLFTLKEFRSRFQNEEDCNQCLSDQKWEKATSVIDADVGSMYRVRKNCRDAVSAAGIMVHQLLKSCFMGWNLI